MSGTAKGGLKTRDTNKSKYGEDFYQRLGRIGGKTPTKLPKGFAANKERARVAGAIGGKKSKRGVKIPVRVEKTLAVADLRFEKLPWWRVW